MRTSSSSSEIGVSSKTFHEGQVGVVDLGLKLQNQNRSFPCNQSDISLVRRRSSVGGACDDDDNDGDGGRVGGPPFNQYPMMSDIYNFSATTVAGDSSSVHSSASVAVRAFQPFDVSYPSEYSPFKPSGGGMATAAVGFPFTAAQWKELERQAMIYKYMVASLPVPPNLLYSSFPATSTTFAPTSYLLGRYGNGLNFKWVGNSKDAEPGRCRRTDGKKWRCSRDVAPNQKYCERHMHRGRPRSRKPVELVHHPNSLSDFPINKLNSSNNNSTKIKNNPTKKTRLNDSNPQSVGSSSFSSVPPSKASAFYHPMASCASPFEDSRSLAWSEEQQWQQLVQTNINSQVFHHQFEGEPLNLNTHAGLVAKSDMGLLERPLIDAWSMGITGIKDNSGNNKASFSSSNVNHGNAMDDEMCQIHMGLGVLDQWPGTTPSPGGPLAEVLRPGSVATTSRSASNPATSDAGEGDFITPTATAVSSPSGVLQKTLASFSDSSGSSSPTGHNSKAKSDMPFRWLN